MAVRKVFSDDNGNDLDCYLNDKDQVFMSIVNKDNEAYSNFITLDKNDCKELIATLQELLPHLSDE